MVLLRRRTLLARHSPWATCSKHASRPASRCLEACLGAWVGGGCFFFAEQDNFKPQCLPTASGVSSSSWAGPMSSSPLQHCRHRSHFWLKVNIGLLLQSRPFVFFYVANQQNPLIPSRQPSSLSRSKIGYNALLSTSCGLKFCAVAALTGPHKQYYAGKSDSCGVRTHALTDWRLKPAP